MIIISARGNFTKPNKISKKLTARVIDLLNPGIKKGTSMSNEALIRAVKDKRIILLIHGYNNSFEELCGTYHIIENKINESKLSYDAVIGFAWPGGSTLFSFFAAKKRAKELKEMKSTLLRDIVLRYAKSVDIMAHSLGCYLLLEYIKKGKLYKINNNYLMAAAVKNHRICKGEDLYSPTKRCSGLYVFRSEQDSALEAFGFVMGAEALGRKGPHDLQAVYDTVRVVNCSDLPDPIKHNSYKHRSEIFNFISRHPIANQIPGIEVPVI